MSMFQVEKFAARCQIRRYSDDLLKLKQSVEGVHFLASTNTASAGLSDSLSILLISSCSRRPNNNNNISKFKKNAIKMNYLRRILAKTSIKVALTRQYCISSIQKPHIDPAIQDCMTSKYL